jgi:hypothetical protein
MAIKDLYFVLGQRKVTVRSLKMGFCGAFFPKISSYSPQNHPARQQDDLLFPALLFPTFDTNQST